jgi:dolichol kinase
MMFLVVIKGNFKNVLYRLHLVIRLTILLSLFWPLLYLESWKFEHKPVILLCLIVWYREHEKGFRNS